MKLSRALGLAAVMALSLTSAIGVGSAPASGPVSKFVSNVNNDNVFVDGAATLGFQGDSKSCTEVVLWGTLSGEAADQLELEFESNCTLVSNDCRLILRPGARAERQPASNSFRGNFAIGPEECGAATVKYGLHDKCTATIPPQEGSQLQADFTNEGDGTVGVSVSTQGLEYVASGPSAWGCANETLNEGSLTAEWDLEGGGDLEVVPAPSGMYLTGEESEEVSQQPRFEAEGYPTTFSGEESEAQLPTFSVYGSGTTTTKCSNAWFWGEITGATSELPVLVTQLDQCKTGSFPASVKLEGGIPDSGCFVFHALNIGPPYLGSADVACDEYQTMDIMTYANQEAQEEGEVLCNAAVVVQNAEGISYTNVGTGSERGIAIEADLEGLEFEFTANSAFCPLKTGTYEDGAIAFATELQG